MRSVVGKVRIELRDDGEVAAIVGKRVRVAEPAPGDSAKPYRAFVVLSLLSTAREKRRPVQRTFIGVRCYGRTQQEAEALYGACSDAVHDIGPRTHGDVGIYLSSDNTGGTAGKDPDTSQPYVEFTIDLFATTQAVA